VTLALAAALALAPQLLEDARGPWLRARREHFLAAWVAADDGRRALALRELERLATPGAPPLGATSAQALGRAWRALTRAGEAPDGDLDALERLAESLDLRAVPGVFESGAQPRPVTVHVLSPESARWGAPLELRLTWLAPPASGLAPERARTTQAFPDAFTPEGFELYVRTPEQAVAGTWRLELELVDGERVAAVPALDVEALAPRGEPEDERGRALERELEAWRRGGAPHTPGLLAADLFDERGGRFERLSVNTHDTWVWRPDGELRGIAVLLSPQRDPAAAPLCGVRGEAWRAAARAAGLLLVPMGVGGRSSTAELEPLLDAARAAASSSERPCVLVARADTAPYLALGRGAEPPFEAWVLSWASPTPPRLPWRDTPTRVLWTHAPAAGAPLDAQHPAQLAFPGTGVPLLDDLRLPDQARALAESLAR